MTESDQTSDREQQTTNEEWEPKPPTLTEVCLWTIANVYLFGGLAVLVILAALEATEGSLRMEEIITFAGILVGHLISVVFVFFLYHIIRYLRLIASKPPQ
ncbi:MAG: hypothetical protein ACLFV7_01170 [Phycisphaerae bacterium]